MGGIIFRKREHLSERQRVVGTLKIMAVMGPIARLSSEFIGAQLSATNSNEIPRRFALSG